MSNETKKQTRQTVTELVNQINFWKKHPDVSPAQLREAAKELQKALAVLQNGLTGTAKSK